MKKACFAVFLIALVASVNATPNHADSFEDALQFAEGLLEGIGSSCGTLSSCLKDVDNIITEGDAAFRDLYSGFENKDKPSIERGFEELGAALYAVARAVHDCDIEGYIDDIERIAAEFSSPAGALEVLLEEGIKLLWNHKEVTHDIECGYDDWENASYHKSGYCIGNLIGILL